MPLSYISINSPLIPSDTLPVRRQHVDFDAIWKWKRKIKHLLFVLNSIRINVVLIRIHRRRSKFGGEWFLANGKLSHCQLFILLMLMLVHAHEQMSTMYRCVDVSFSLPSVSSVLHTIKLIFIELEHCVCPWPHIDENYIQNCADSRQCMPSQSIHTNEFIDQN